MHIVKTHTQRTMEEIANLVLESGSYTAPIKLPHYRYTKTKLNCATLEEAKIIKKCNTSGINATFVAAENMPRWVAEGKPRIMDFCNRISKERNKNKLKKIFSISCVSCGADFTTQNLHQKRCVSTCGKPYFSTQTEND